MERRVRPQPAEDLAPIGRPERALAEAAQLLVDLLNLGEARGVDIRRIEVERGVQPDQPPVVRGAAGKLTDPGPLVRPGVGQDLVAEGVPQADQRRADPDSRGLPKVLVECRDRGRRPVVVGLTDGVEECPLVVALGEDLVERCHHARNRRPDGHPAAGEPAPEVDNVLVDPGAQAAPPLDQVAPFEHGPDRLERLDVEGHHLRPFERIDGPVVQAAGELREVALELVDQRGMGRPVAGVGLGRQAAYPLEQGGQRRDVGGDRPR